MSGRAAGARLEAVLLGILMWLAVLVVERRLRRLLAPPAGAQRSRRTRS